MGMFDALGDPSTNGSNLNYGDAPAPEEKVNLDTTNVSPLPDDALNTRAGRADFALGDKSPGVPVLKDAFKNGQEPAVRQTAAADANADFQQEKLDHIKAAAAQDAPVSEKQVNDIMALGTTPEANPDTVLEDKFAKNFVSIGVVGDPTKNAVFQSAFDAAAEQTRQGVQIATGAVSRKTQAQGLLEETEAAHDSLPWFSAPNMLSMGLSGDEQRSKFGDLAVGVLSGGIAQYVNQRNLLNSAPTNSFLPGSNKLEQIQYLYLLPHDQFLPALRAAAGPGSPLFKESPSSAVDFVRSAVQFSVSDAYVDNAMGIANVASIIPVGKGLKAITALRNGRLSGAAKAAVDANQVTSAAKAAEDVLSASPTPPTPPGLSQGGQQAAGAAGDVLSAPSKPPAPGYYVPKNAVVKTELSASKNNPPTVPRNITTQVGPDGVPHVFNEDGMEIVLKRTPEEGHLPVNVTPTERPLTYTTKGGTEQHTPGTVYMDLPSVNKLAPLDDTTKRTALLQHDNGKYFVGDHDQSPGKEIRGTRVSASDTPQKGLYPVTTDEDGKVTVGQKITRVDQADTRNTVSFGPEIVKQEEVEAKVALADIVKSSGETHPQDVLGKMGQHEAAAQIGATNKITDTIGQAIHKDDPEEIRRQVPSLASPQLYYHNSSSLTRERADRLAQNAIQSSTELSQALTDPVRVERLTKPALDHAVQIAKDQVRSKYNRNADVILDQVNHWDSASNTYHVETRFGKKDGTLFDTSASAENAHQQYGLGPSASVRQEGNQFYLSHVQHIDETQSGVRNTLIVSGNETPRGWWNSLLTAVTGKFAPLGNSIRSSASTLSPFQMSNRVVATHSPSIMRNAIEDVAKDINSLGGRFTTKERQELQTILEHNRDYMSPDGVRGKFYTSALEFETAFNDHFGYMPTEKQIVAYDQFTRLSDLDWTLRELDALRDKARLGVRNYRIPIKGADGSVDTEWFNGKLVKDFDPLNTQNANVYVTPLGKFTTKYDLHDKSVVSEAINDKLKSGEYHIIQTYAPKEKPLLKTTGVKDDIHFVVTDKYEDKAVAFGENVDYRPGGHVIYQDQHYIKQARVGPGTNGRMTHFGDTSIKAFSTEREAKLWADKYNVARELIHNGDEAGLQAYIAGGNLPETVPEIKRMFSDGTLSTDVPIVHTFAGRDTFQSSEALATDPRFKGLKDQFSSYNLSQTQGTDFLADRGAQLNTIKNQGTEANPLYTNVPSRLFDPYTSLQKGMAQIVRSRWMADYKISAAESWVQEFGHLFDQSKLPIDKLRQNPVYWLYHAEGNIDAGVMKTNPELVTAAMTSRKNIMNFLGSRDEVGAILEGLQKKVVNGIARIAGDNIARRAEETFLPAISNALQYAREASFNAVMGLFNPAQLWQQAQGLAHVYALAPLHAIESTTASALVRLYRHTEDAGILASAADKAEAFGWNRDHFLEALDGWKRSGTHMIGGETSLLSTTGDPQIFKNGANWFLNKGQMFFKAGESIVRDTSWFTAYREWRAANPTAVLNNRALGDIGNRFQVLSLDMTRASNSALNEGILSIPTQFWTWNARFAEQMLGKRLTLGEKARVLTTYSAMYGIPATLGGVTFGVIPDANYGDIREYAISHNIDIHNKWYQAFSEGLPTLLLNSITGHETSLQRFGPNATQIKDIIDGKKSAMEMLGGASGTFVAQVMKTVQPALMYGFSAMQKDSGFPIKWNDLMNVAENVSTLNNAEKAIIGWNMGTYSSKTEGFITGVDRFESAALALGLNPQRVNDAYTGIDYLKNLKSAQAGLTKKMTEDWTLAMKAGLRGDYQTMTDYMTRVQAWTAAGNFTKAQEIDIFKHAIKGQEGLVDSVNQRMLKDNPLLQSIPAYKTYIENRKY